MMNFVLKVTAEPDSADEQATVATFGGGTLVLKIACLPVHSQVEEEEGRHSMRTRYAEIVNRS